MQETWVQPLGWEDPWRRKWQPTAGFLPGKCHGQGAWGDIVRGVTKSQTELSAETTIITIIIKIKLHFGQTFVCIFLIVS